MNILVLNGSPRKKGTTSQLVGSFLKGCFENKHKVDVVNVCEEKISGCIACEYCHTNGNGKCIQDDDMQEIYPLLEQAELLIIASPIYYYSLTGQLQCAINRIYALDKPKNLKKAALILSSGDNDVYDGAIYEFEKSFIEYLRLEDLGVFTLSEKENRLEERAKELYLLGKNLK